MTWAHLHLVLNHVPVVGLPIALLLLAVALLRRSTELAKTSLALLALVAAVTIVVQLTGESAEELVEHLPGVSESLVEHHEEAALMATIGMSVLGLVALVVLVRFRAAATIPSWIGGGILLLGILVGGFMGWTANLGGQIRHTEIRPAGVATKGPYPPRANRTAAITMTIPSSALSRATRAARTRSACASGVPAAARPARGPSTKSCVALTTIIAATAPSFQARA